MENERYYLVAISRYEGKLEEKHFKVAAPNGYEAVFRLLDDLEAQNRDVWMIFEVVGVHSMQELSDIMKNGPRPGVHFVAHVFDEEK